MRDALVCVYDGIVVLCGQSGLNLRQFQLSFWVRLWVFCKAVITADVDVLLITELLDATYSLFFPILNVFEVKVPL